MFKYYSIKKYDTKLLPTLAKRYGSKTCYSASQVRATVYQKNFNPKYLPLAYLYFLDSNTLKDTLYIEFPELDIREYQQEICEYITQKKLNGYLKNLNTNRPA
jgi:hypothetical protein